MAETTYLNPIAAREARSLNTSRPKTGPINVGEVERLASGVGGGLLLLLGLNRGGVGGLATAAVGGMFLLRGATGHCGMYQALGIDTRESSQGDASSVRAGQGVKVETAVTINRPREELFAFWRDFNNLPRIMRHLRSVTVMEGNRSRWVASGPPGTSVEWEAEVINERPHELIAWRSLDGSEVDTAGSVRFDRAPGGRGTELHVALRYDPPAGRLGAAIARLFGRGAEGQVVEDLRRFKQVMEAGEAPTTEGQPSGRRP